MNERQRTVCAIALFADGFTIVQIAAALGVDIDQAQGLMDIGAEEQAAGTMGHMSKCPFGKDQVVSRRDHEGQVTGTLNWP